jgi:Smr domain
MNEKSGACRIRHARLVTFGRLILLAVVWPFGLCLLLGGVEPFSGLLCLFAGIWLLLDNPLEFLAAFSGTCPACGAEVTGRGRSPCRCPSCGAAINVEEQRLHLAEPQTSPSESTPEDVAEAGEGSPFGGPLPFAPGDTLDLHTFSPREVAPLVGDFLDLCEQTGMTRARIIHGKGTGVLRQRVRALLARDPRVILYEDAPPEAGGWGATVVQLRLEAKRDARKPSEA